MSQGLFAYPKQAEFGRTLPKNKIYEHSQSNAALRRLLVRQVDHIVWQYKLAPETVNLPARPGVPEIQVFSIALKTPELSEEVLRCIDQAIPFPIFHLLTFENRIKTAAAYKRPSEADAGRWVVGAYFAAPWQPADSARAPLPVALDLGGLYEQMLRQLMPLPPRAEESLQQQVERLAHIRAKQSECLKMEARLQREKQFNRKVEINAQLRALQAEIERLKIE